MTTPIRIDYAEEGENVTAMTIRIGHGGIALRYRHGRTRAWQLLLNGRRVLTESTDMGVCLIAGLCGFDLTATEVGAVFEKTAFRPSRRSARALAALGVLIPIDN